MTLEEARRQVWDSIAAPSRPVNPERILRYERELAEDYGKYLVESRGMAKKTAEMSKANCVG